MLGSMMSRVIRTNGCCTASTSAASAEAACSTVKPSASSCTRISSADLTSSSTTSATRAPARAWTLWTSGSLAGATAASSGARSGNHTVKQEPSPAALSTATDPPCNSASSFTMANPRPVPSNLRARPLSI